MENIVELLLYNGASKEDYILAMPLARESNRRSVCSFSLIGFAAFLAAAIMKHDNEVGMDAKCFWGISFVFLMMAFICFSFGKKRTCVCQLFTYLIIALILSVGIYSAISQPTERATLILVFFVLSSVMFYSAMLWNIIITITAELLFIFFLSRTQVGQIYFENLVNSIIFSVVGMFSSMYLMRVKCERFLYEAKSKKLLEIDAMTSLYNRYSFNLEIERIKQVKESVTICSFDLNGLKVTNDSLGHLAGDELIVACAQCIKDVFGQYGNVFRVGGDEFVAILNGVGIDEKNLLRDLEDRCRAWKGIYINGFTVSCGIAKSETDIPLEEAIKMSDILMYENKKRYHDGVTNI